MPHLFPRPRASRVLPSALCAVLAVSTGATGCSAYGFSGLAFKVDKRVKVVSPRDRSHVTLPVTVSWTAQDFRIVGPGAGPTQGSAAGYFGVFVDSSPVPHGQTLAYLARKDHTCRPADGCPNAEYLAARGVYTTTDTSIVITQLSRPVRSDGHEHHYVTIVLLDPSGRRIGESFFRVELVLDRKVLS
ncbi:MAG: hypothetical protein M3N21_00575 [Actinomycetota bacterium]|nr:hypothetical protein [Actinomycetota bacterium]